MSIIYILIPVAVLLTALGIYFFFWAVKTEQFDDLEKQGMSILFDEKAFDVDDNNNTLQVAACKDQEEKEEQEEQSNK